MSGIAFAYAEESADGKEELNQNIIDQIDKLDTEELQKYIDSLGIFSDKNIGERLFDYIRGENHDYGSFGEQILGVLFEDVKNMLPAFAASAPWRSCAGYFPRSRAALPINPRRTSFF